MSPYPSTSPIKEHKDPLAGLDWEGKVEKVYFCECCGSPRIYAPVLVCGECGRALPVRCYVYRRSGKYYAECLTLNLLSRGETQEDAIRRLQIAMFSYLQTVLGDGSKPTAGLIPRRAPFSSWARFYFLRFKRWISRIVGRDYPLATESKPSGDQIRVAHC